MTTPETDTAALLARLYDPDPAALSRLRDSLVGDAAAGRPAGRRLPHAGHPGRHAAAGRDRAGTGSGGLRHRGSRPGAGLVGGEDQPPHSAVARPPGRDRAATVGVLRRRAEGLSSCRWTSGCRPDSAAACWPTCRTSPTDTPRATRRSRRRPAARGRSGRSAARARRTRSRSSCRAIGWCGPTGRSVVTGAAPRRRSCC